ncbi:hypothetical protein L1987_13398 [Smallanthus sonchifolius]|uniref:Uncharacterized protein n=1 Tax=Smallanthus sonchifolius TaxID=185202 RepID=A0ACB9JHF6_9ASTR|nr:hypothetical protein L1987_13398 [Smallanthus sonchifolius]
MKTPDIDLSHVPYPVHLLPHKEARKYGTFLDMFKQLKLSLPFIDVLQHMPKYGKFLKDHLSNKKKLEWIFEVSLCEQRSAVVQNKLPEKLVDLGRFTILCLLGGFPLNHGLVDLGASYPWGIMENLLVKVGKFVFPVDFVILDMGVDDKVPLILGCPFLRTAKAVIDVFDGKLILHVEDEMITFDARKPMKDVGKHSHSKLLEESDEYNDEVPDDLLEMMEEFDEIIGKSPSVGMIEESIKDHEDPGESIRAITIANHIPELLPITIVHSEGRTTEPTTSASAHRSRPPRKRTRALIDSSDFGRMQTPSVGTSRGDKLFRYLNQVVFGPGRFKFWWKDQSDRHNGVFSRSSCLLGMWIIGRLCNVKAGYR